MQSVVSGRPCEEAPIEVSEPDVLIQVGLELEVVSKDERDLIQGRAELEALLTQQRSAQAARVQSPPSTSCAPGQQPGIYHALFTS